jgi:hypothetical protein
VYQMRSRGVDRGDATAFVIRRLARDNDEASK